MALRRLVLRAVIGPSLTVFAVAFVLLAIGSLAQALLQSAVVPDLDLLVRMAAAASGIAVPLAALVGGVVGASAAGARLREEGAWLALRTVGVSPARLFGEVVGVALAGGAVVWIGMHAVEPAARSLLREARVAAVVRVRPVEGRTLQLGAWAIAAEGGVLHFIGTGAVGAAPRWQLTPAQTGVIAHLEDVVVRDPDGTWSAAAETLDVPVGLPGTSGKVHVTERATANLLAQIRSHPGDAYEEWILWKRTVVPIMSALMAIGAFGMTVGRRWPVPAVGGSVAVGLWAVIRICDGAIKVLGAPGATAAGLTAALVVLAAGWRRVA